MRAVCNPNLYAAFCFIIDIMKSTSRIELDLAIRKSAIDIASTYGIEGVEYFQQEFAPIAKEYAEGIAEELSSLGFPSRVEELSRRDD